MKHRENFEEGNKTRDVTIFVITGLVNFMNSSVFIDPELWLQKYHSILSDHPEM